MIALTYEGKPPRNNTKVRDGDFTYALMGWRRKAGHYTLIWSYACADCGAREMCETPMKGQLKNRRCRAHMNPLMPATPDARKQMTRGINKTRAARGLRPLTPVEALVQMRKAAATLRDRAGRDKPAPIPRKRKAATVPADSAPPPKSAACVFDPDDIDERGERDDGRQYCLVRCQTHNRYEWAWVDL